MDSALTQALADFRQGTRRVNWYGKTYADFWRWFSEQEKRLKDLASPADQDELRLELFEITADCDDAGFAVPDERANDVIQRPD